MHVAFIIQNYEGNENTAKRKGWYSNVVYGLTLFKIIIFKSLRMFMFAKYKKIDKYKQFYEYFY